MMRDIANTTYHILRQQCEWRLVAQCNARKVYFIKTETKTFLTIWNFHGVSQGENLNPAMLNVTRMFISLKVTSSV